MNNFIKILPPNIINQIAAGEIIHRPSSIVKELLENAIDAKAKAIDLVINNSGKTLIKSIDNGEGMSMEDAIMSIKRYATSKIYHINDLFNIYTKGFRGEALAAIAAISKMEIRTKNKMSDFGAYLIIENGLLTNKSYCQTIKGTIISVKNIFYNIPVRRRFLKSENIEFHYIVNEFYKLVLAHADINFRLYHNNKLIFDLKKTSIKQRIIEIFGKYINDNIIFFYEKINSISVEGFIIKPTHYKKTKSEQFIFVNNRYIKNYFLHKTILNAFSGLLNYPSYFIFLNIDPKYLDINIHPDKTEIQFDNEYTNIICDMLLSNIKKALGQYKITDFNIIYENFLPKDYNKLDFNINNNQISIFNNINNIYEEQNKKSLVFLKEYFKNTFSKYKEIYFFQFDYKYIIANLEFDLIIIDQYRAHQRILYDHFMKNINNNLDSKNFLFPIKINLLPNEIIIIKELEIDLIKLGFAFEFFKNYIKIKASSVMINQNCIVDFIHKVLDNYLIKNNFNSNELFVNNIAKLAAIKRGIKLNILEIEYLFYSLFFCKNHNFTPFGKKIYIFLNKKNIDKQFN
ncbi:MAG: DNA mismatch repair endonuclease MutL [Candidatus Bostrichicola ureolyticus]|nr:MAG: DNA mismatch repair endonuclease MutL [Candidatus Bostrichicola ureolyticus]